MIKDIINYIKLLFQKDKELYFDLKKIIGFYPGDIELYKTALMHKSIMHRNKKGKPVNNERLEFLGDAVLDAVVGDIVYRHFPGKREGFLTNTRSKLVQRETLGKLANEMGITKLVLSSGRNQSHNSYLGGNAFEALVGAIYLDRGYDACMKFMEKRILNKMINIDKVAYKEVNFKSKLLEWTQKNRINLSYELQEQTKDENGSPVFCYKVILETVEGCVGKGYSKKESQQIASKLTLDKLKKDKNYLDSIFAAKTDRTKMEEEPVLSVPETEVKDDFIISEEKPEPQIVKSEQPKEEKNVEVTEVSNEEVNNKKPRRQRKPKAENENAEKKVEGSNDNKQEEPKTEKKQVKSEKKETKAENKEVKIEKKEEAKSEKKENKSNNKENKSENKEAKTEKAERKPRNSRKKSQTNNESENDDEFDLSDISNKAQSREEIIAAAEAAAFAEE